MRNRGIHNFLDSPDDIWGDAVSKTRVAILNDLRHDPIKAGATGYVDGYVRGGDDTPCAVVVIDGSFYLVSTRNMKAIL